MNPYGSVPGAIQDPNPYGDLNTAMGGSLGAINSSIFSNLLSESQGQIPQADQNFMQDQAAAKAAASGMPGTNIMPGTLEGNSAARNLGLLQYQLQQSAAQQYPSLTGAVSQTQTVSPALQTQIAGTNAVNASAPNPQMAQSYAQQLYDKYAKEARGPGGSTITGGGPAGGTMPTTTRTGTTDAGGAGGQTGDVFGLGDGSTGVFGNMGQSWDDLFNTSPTGAGGSAPWQQAGYPSEQAYNDALDASMFGDMEGSPEQVYAGDIYDPYGDIFGGG
jgi:hypothetical protein